MLRHCTGGKMKKQDMSNKRTDNTGRKKSAGKPTPSGTKDKSGSTGKKGASGKMKSKSAKGSVTAAESGAVQDKKKAEWEKSLAKNPYRKSPGAKRIYKGSKKHKGKSHSSVEGDRNYGDAFNGSEMLDAENVLKKERPESYLHYLKPLPKAKAPSSPFKRMLKRLLFYTLTVLVLVSVCFVLSITVFFKIDEIEVEGETRYPAEDIISACQINTGDNLILCNTSPGETEIWKKFPYIESVDIRKKLFNKIIISVKEAVPTSMIESDGKYVLLSESGKIIDISDKKQGDVPIVMGAKLMTPKLSSSVKYKDPKVEEYISEILASADEYKFSPLRVIDISNLSKIVIEIKTGLHIVIGTPENIDYKLKTAKKIIDKDIHSDDVGTLDVSLSSADGGKSFFSSKKKPEESSAKPQPAQQSSAAEKPKTSEQESQVSETSSVSQPETSSEVTAESTVDNDGGESSYIPDNDTGDDNDYTPDYDTGDDNDYTPDYDTGDDNDYTLDYDTGDDNDYTPDYDTGDDNDYTPDYDTGDDNDYTPDYDTGDDNDYTPDYGNGDDTDQDFE